MAKLTRISLLFSVTVLVLCGVSSISSAEPTSLPHRTGAVVDTSVNLSDFANARAVTAAVKRAESQASAPRNEMQQLQVLANNADFGNQLSYSTCPSPSTFVATANVSRCTFGDLAAKRTIVLTGDSRAEMWFDTIDSIASATHMKLVLLAKTGCASASGTYDINNNGAVSQRPWPACTAWHNFVNSTIRSLKPQLVIQSSSDILNFTSDGLAPNGDAQAANPAQESAAFAAFFKTIHAPTRLAVLGGFPTPWPAQPTLCLSKSPKAVSQCAFHVTAQTVAENAALQRATQDARATYINQTPWLCAASCPAVIAGIIPYTIDGFHMDDTYAHYLTGVAWAALETDLR